MAIWTPVVDDSFTHAGTTTGVAGSTTGMPTTPAVGAANGWTDYSGGVWQIGTTVPNAALGTDIGGSHRPTGKLQAALRLTPGEAARDQRVIVDFDIIDSNLVELYLIGRYAGGGKCYACNILQSAGNGYGRVWIPDGSNNGANPVFSSSAIGVFNAAHNHRLQVDFVGINPTTITFTWTDLTTSTVVGSVSTTDSTAALQIPGAAGLCTANGQATIVNRFQLLSGALSAGIPTVTGTTRTTISLSTTAPSGGTAPLTNSWWRGPSGVSNFVPPGQGTQVSGTGLTLTDTPGGSPGDIFYYRSGVTDSSTPTPLFLYSGVVAGSTLKAGPSIGLIGDSRTANYATDATAHAAQKYAAAWANLFPDYDFAVTNWGVSSTDSAYWTTGRGNIQVAVAGILAAGATWVVYMIGANDSRGTDFTSAATFQANVSNAVNYMVSQGLNVQLDEAGYQVPNQPPGSLWTDQSPALTVGYTAALDALCDGVHVFKGDRQSTRYLMNKAATVLASDNVHNDMALTAPFSVAALGRNLGYLGAAGSGGGGGGYSRARSVGGV